MGGSQSSNSQEKAQISDVLVLEIVAARGLQGLKHRDDGNAFVTVTFGEKTYKSRVVHATPEATWNQKLIIPVAEPHRRFSAVIDVWQVGRLGALNDFLGHCKVPIEDAVAGSVVDKWFTLWSHREPESAGTHEAGELHLRLRTRARQEIETEFWSKLVHAADVDNAGALNRRELVTLLEVLSSPGTEEQEIEAMLSTAGVSPDATFGPDELRQLMIRPEVANRLDPENCPLCGHGMTPEEHVVVHMAGCLESGAVEDADVVEHADYLTTTEASEGWLYKRAEHLAFGTRRVGGEPTGHILVINSATAAVEEEKMPFTERVFGRLMYQMTETAPFIQRLMRAAAKRTGRWCDSEASAKEIRPFVDAFGVNVEEIAQPLDSFRTFNEFFTRELRPGVRKIAAEDDGRVLVSPADSRVTVYPTVDEATRFWIKGKRFSLPALLQDDALAAEYEGGSLGVFRLAPQDYHRFHFPANGTVLDTRRIDGWCHYVNPLAVRTGVDILTENIRTVTVLDTQEFGKIAYVPIGASMVSSIVLKTPPGTTVKKGDEFGNFQYGGSTIVLLFEKDTLKWNDDLLENSRRPIETLIKIGNAVGTSVKPGFAESRDAQAR